MKKLMLLIDQVKKETGCHDVHINATTGSVTVVAYKNYDGQNLLYKREYTEQEIMDSDISSQFIIHDFIDNFRQGNLPDYNELNKIAQMSHLDMATLWRNTPAGHPWFDISKPYHEVFKKKFDDLGGFTPAISKHIGWDG